MFGKLKEKLMGGASRISGKTDLLEGVCAGLALVIYADGSAGDDEIASGLSSLENHETISVAFKANEIEQAFNKQLNRAKGGMAGRLALKRELAEAKDKNTFEDMEMLLMIVIDAAAAEGGLDEKEKTVIREIGKTIGVTADSYL